MRNVWDRVWKVAIVAVALVMVLGIITWKGQTQTSQGVQEYGVAATVAQAAPAAAKELPRFLDLGAEKCYACKAMVPVIEDLRKSYAGKLRVDFIDVNKEQEAARPYKIQMIPTQILFDAKGRELYRHVGFFSKKEIVAKFNELGVKL